MTNNEKQQKVQLDPTRHNLVPPPTGLSIEKLINLLIAEGQELLLQEEQTASVKNPPPPQQALEDALGEKSSNPYIKSRVEVLKKMKPSERAIIERMEKNEIPRDSRWDQFQKWIIIRGDQLSS